VPEGYPVFFRHGRALKSHDAEVFAHLAGQRRALDILRKPVLGISRPVRGRLLFVA